MFGLLETFVSVGHLSNFIVKVSNRKTGLILQNSAFLFNVLTYIKIMSSSHPFRSDLARSRLGVFCEIKLLKTHSEIWNPLHSLSKGEPHLVKP